MDSYSWDEKDSSVTGSVWGLAIRKTIYRKGIGCTLINDISEEEIRKQVFIVPEKPLMNMDSLLWPYGDKILLTENYSLPSNVTKMLFSKGDMASYVSSLPLKYPPGTRFYYSSGNANVLSSIIRKTNGEKK